MDRIHNLYITSQTNKTGNTNYNYYLVFGRFPAELGPETRSNGSGSKMMQNAPKISPGDQF